MGPPSKFSQGQCITRVIIWDINNILSQEVKKGGRRYPIWLIQGFHEVIEACDVIDMDMHGYPFTWERGHKNENWIEIRFDLALATKSWVECFPDAKLTNMEITTSDHTPLLLKPFISRQ